MCPPEPDARMRVHLRPGAGADTIRRQLLQQLRKLLALLLGGCCVLAVTVAQLLQCDSLLASQLQCGLRAAPLHQLVLWPASICMCVCRYILLMFCLRVKTVCPHSLLVQLEWAANTVFTAHRVCARLCHSTAWKARGHMC